MLPNGYMFLDPEDYDEAAERLANRYIRVSSDKEIEAIVGTDDENPEVIGALFTGYTKYVFSFDIVVRHDHRKKGIARSLVQVAIDQYEQLKDAFGEEFHMEIDVINPDMERLLKSMGFKVYKTLGKDHVHMTKESTIMRAVQEMIRINNNKKAKKSLPDQIKGSF